MADFYRLNHIKHVIECDYDVRRDREVRSEAICVMRYRGVMARILELPVAAWDCPATAAGEIDTERKTKMWNQNNGNGQGNGPQNPGYGGQPQQAQVQGYGQQDVYERLNNSRDVGGARFPYIEAGIHKLALVVLEEFGNANEPKVRAVFKTLESRSQPVGNFCVKIFSLTKPSKFPNQPTEADEFADFCRKLKGAPVGTAIGASIRTLMKDRVSDQLARGTVIEANGVINKKGTYVRVYWNNVPQSPQDIAFLRQRLESEGVPSTSEGPGQMQGGYQQSAQSQYGQGQAQQIAPPVQQPAPQGAPPGGFLANVPTTNGGNGQGGGSW